MFLPDTALAEIPGRPNLSGSWSRRLWWRAKGRWAMRQRDSGAIHSSKEVWTSVDTDFCLRDSMAAAHRNVRVQMQGQVFIGHWTPQITKVPMFPPA